MSIKRLLPVVAMMLTGCVTRTYTVTRPASGPSPADVATMLKAHVSDTVIARQIQNSSPASCASFRLGVSNQRHKTATLAKTAFSRPSECG